MKFRIITQNAYIVEGVEDFAEAWAILKVDIKTPFEDTVKLEHSILIHKEEVDETH